MTSTPRESVPRHLAYDDPAGVAELGPDALRCGIRLRRATTRDSRATPAADLLMPAPPSKASGELSISEAAQRLANALYLHLD